MIYRIILRLPILSFFIWLAFPGVAQNHIVTGKITAHGNPLESASVAIGGTRLGTKTDSKGDYRLDNVTGDTCQIVVYGCNPSRRSGLQRAGGS